MLPQMAAARLERVRVALSSETGDVVLTASGARTRFDGFHRVYREDEDEDGGEVETDRPLPAMAEGERGFVAEVRPERRSIRAPSRYTEAGLVRKLEALGIGRPSTYAAIVGVLREREYVVLYRRRFVPTERGRVRGEMRSVSGRELLLGSAFHLAREGEAGGPGLAAWGHVRVGGFDTEAPAETASVRIDGEVTTGILGTDAEWDRLLARAHARPGGRVRRGDAGGVQPGRVRPGRGAWVRPDVRGGGVPLPSYAFEVLYQTRELNGGSGLDFSNGLDKLASSSWPSAGIAAVVHR